jgi:methyl-accepting chemotaxis protein
MSHNVADVCSAATDITTTIGQITDSTDSAAAVASRTRQNAEQVAAVADQIQGLIHQFTYQT